MHQSQEKPQGVVPEFLRHLQRHNHRNFEREFANLTITRRGVLGKAIDQLLLAGLITSSEEARLNTLSEIITGGKMDAARIEEMKQAVAQMLADSPGEAVRGIATILGEVAESLAAANGARSG